ncbi:uncharacterized protein LOC134534550 [Bacillus rossius redtenbacheri]|uniref:uncharacterized protein LOC134534550 n=1 Tax=Bacillus rossius redtenbacheri TaxID=93214 RepID=UPI002FDD55F9
MRRDWTEHDTHWMEGSDARHTFSGFRNNTTKDYHTYCYHRRYSCRALLDHSEQTLVDESSAPERATISHSQVQSSIYNMLQLGSLACRMATAKRVRGGSTPLAVEGGVVPPLHARRLWSQCGSAITRVLRPEEQLQEAELRAADRLEDERRRRRELLVRADWEKQLQGRSRASCSRGLAGVGRSANAEPSEFAPHPSLSNSKMVLEEYKDLVGAAAGTAVTLAKFSGVFTCKSIIKQRSTRNVPVYPFLSGAVLSIILLQNSLLMQDSNLIISGVVGLAIQIVYMLIYYIFCENKADFWTKVLKASIFVGLVLAYCAWEDAAKARFWLGILITAFLLIYLASPLMSLGDVIRTKSTAMLPLPMILTGAVVSSLMLLYGIIIKDPFIQVQKAIGFGLSVIQLMLFVIYPRRPVDLKHD